MQLFAGQKGLPISIDTVVFLPGICGSVLVDHGEMIWPGTPGQVVFKSYPDRLVQILSSSTTIEAADVLRSVPLTLLGLTVHHFPGYGQALKVLEQMGYSEAGGSLIPFPYDWRKDIRDSAEALHARLSQPDLQGMRVAIVAHSMGGLVSRFALEKPGIPAGLNLQLLALLATPHLGAPVAMQNLLGLRPEIFLSAKQCRDALQNPQFPSAYQLLPHPGVPALLARSPRIGFSVLDVFGEDIQRQFGLVAGSLVAAKAFAVDLPFMGPQFHPPCPYLAIAGNAQKTVVANYNLPEGVTPVDEDNSGDGTVPLWSAAPPGIPVRYVAAAHLDVCFDSDAVGMLRAVLRPDLPGGRLFSNDPAPVIFTLEPVKQSVLPAETFTVAIVANKPTDSIHVRVVLTRVFGDDRADSPEEVPVDYDGGPVRSIPLEFKAPDQRAVLLFQLVNRDGHNLGEPRSVLVVS
jgi:pimeloyl-ACP methyl ester carboxylesterase